ncbi:hypothetical protein ACEPPN_016814 [Leptodophora sp. 'Broadleaf-Isolate-01']
MAIFKKHSLKTPDDQKTNAAELTLRQSIYPICLVTVLFFLWNTLGITRSRSSGLQAAYFGYV